MKRILLTLALVGASAADQASAQRAPRPHAVDPVITWNRTLLSIVRTGNVQPPTIHPTRSFAILHAAIYDAVNAIDRTHASYLATIRGASRRASQDAAADAAAHDVLVALYPALKTALDAQFVQSLQADAGGDETDGVRIGQAAAAQILAARDHDGASAPPGTYVFGTAPGDYQSTPPNFAAQPQFTHWAFVTPFALERPFQFRPPSPPAVTSAHYADAVNEVKAVGIANSTAATPDEALTGMFWNGAIQNYWNEIAATVATEEHLSTAESARLFALLNLTLADSVIAFYDAKYAYNLWRPVTAIEQANTDDNPDTEADPGWLPQSGRTAADPSYPGAHAVISAAAADVLATVLKRDRFNFTVSSETLSGVTRSFTSFSSAAEEASLSRIFAGQHFRFDQTAGQRMGRQIADFIVDRLLTRVQGGIGR